MDVSQLQQMVLKYLDQIRRILYVENFDDKSKLLKIGELHGRLTTKVGRLQDDDVNNNDNRG